MNYHIVKARVIRFFLVCSLCIVAFTLGGCSKSSVVDTTDTSTDVTNEADVSVQSLDFGATLASLPLELSIANPKDRWTLQRVRGSSWLSLDTEHRTQVRAAIPRFPNMFMRLPRLC